MLVRFAAALFGVMIAAGSATATTWNMVWQFSFKNNPNGVWSYSATYPLFSVKNFSSLKKVNGWEDEKAIPNSELIARDSSGAPVDFLTIVAPTHHLWLDPESGEVTVTWTAPQAGSYVLNGDFLGIDTGQHAHPVLVTNSAGRVLVSRIIQSYGQKETFHRIIQVNKGESINFTVEVGAGGVYTNLSTGLRAVFRQSP